MALEWNIPASESTLTDRYQTTIPAPIRQALGLKKRDKISYTIQSDGRVEIARAEYVEADPVLEQFLDFLARDIEKNPQTIRALSGSFVDRIQSLISNVEVDLDAPLLEEDE